MPSLAAAFALASVIASSASLEVGPEIPDSGVALPSEADLLSDSASEEEGEEGESGGAEDEGSADEGESEAEAAQSPGVATDGGLLYSADLSDAELERRWVKDLRSLGSISVGFAEAGRVVNGVRLGRGEAWTVVAPEAAWGTQETIDALEGVAREVMARYPDAPPLRVNHISKEQGGYLRPHQSHQSGRDVDLGFYYKPGFSPRAVRGARESAIDLAQNWALVRALVTLSDVQVILVDRRVQKVLYEHALGAGEDKAWLDRLFHAGPGSLLRHARRHRDHFHVRFFSARSQELGRRVQPLLAKRPEENVLIHRIRKGDTLGRIAMRYGSGVKLIQKANRMRSTLLSIGRTLNVPLRGPCTQCPLPPPVRVPPRILPPDFKTSPALASGRSVAAPDGGLPRLNGALSPAPDAGALSVVFASASAGAADGGEAAKVHPKVNSAVDGGTH